MKKCYTTIFCVYISSLVFAQKSKDVENNFFLRQNNDKIEVVQKSGNSLGYNNGGDPNGVVVIQDSYGNKYWVISDGTVAKYEPSSTSKNITNSRDKEVNIIPSSSKTTRQSEIPTIERKSNSIGKTEGLKTNQAAIQTKVSIPEKTSIANEDKNLPKQTEERVSTPITTAIQAPRSNTNQEVENQSNIDISSLFEERFDKLPKKERKEREKNERKIRKELEQELKQYRKENKTRK